MAFALQGNTSGGETQAVNTTRFSINGMARDRIATTTEAFTAITCRAPGVLNNLQALISANTLSTAGTTIKSRVNAADGAMSISIAAGVTGLVSDLSNSDTLADGDTYDIATVVASGGTGTIVIRSKRTNFEATTDHAAVFASYIESAFDSASSDIFASFAGSGGLTNPEANSKFQVDVAGTLSHIQTYVSANIRGTASTLRTRINGADGNQVVSIGASATGFFEDTSNSDSLTAGDDINPVFRTGTGGGGTTTHMLSVLFVNTTNGKNNIYLGCDQPSRGASATPSFYFPFGYLPLADNTTESQLKMQHNFDVINSQMKVFIPTNTYTGNGTMTSRKNGAAGAQTISLTAAGTGLFEDVTNSDSLGPTDDFCYSIVDGTSGSIAIRWMGSLEQSLVTTETAIQKSLTYRVQTEEAVTKSLTYKVRANQAITKSLTYAVRIEQTAITKSLHYEVTATPSAITKSLEYRIASLIYSREFQASVPAGIDDLATRYTEQELEDVSIDDDIYVSLLGNTVGFLLHQFKFYHTNSTDPITVTVRMKSIVAPSASTVFLQIYNFDTDLWENLDSDSGTAADTEFELKGTKTLSADYYGSPGNLIVARIYQEK